MRTYTLTIDGHLPTKANSRRIVLNRKTKKPFSIKSEEANTWTEACILKCKTFMAGKKPLVGEVGLRAHVYYRSNRSDLDVSLLQDGLQKGGIYVNDRQIVQVQAFKHIDKLNPRCIIEVWEIQSKIEKNTSTNGT